MASYVTLITFTETGEAHSKDSPKRAAAFKAKARSLGVKVKEILCSEGQSVSEGDALVVLE